MKDKPGIRIKSLVDLFDIINENERVIVDVLRQIITATLPKNYKEKISYNVPLFYGNKGICIIWPATIPRGGIKNGVLLGLWYGNRINDADGYLTHGTNKQIFYKIFYSPEEINEKAIKKLLNEAVRVDQQKKRIRFKLAKNNTKKCF
ncbi:MAG: DUF1801 domain-containing protein [Bacteroidia bacterium]